jgi:hypothetical protein
MKNRLCKIVLKMGSFSGKEFSFWTLSWGALMLFVACMDKTKCDGPDREEYFDIREDRLVPLKAYQPCDTLVFKTDKGIFHTFISGQLDSGYKDYVFHPDEFCPTKKTEYKQFKGYFFYSNTYPGILQYVVSIAQEGVTWLYLHPKSHPREGFVPSEIKFRMTHIINVLFFSA